MKTDEMIIELRRLRDRHLGRHDQRYDRIIDALEAQRKAIWGWLTKVADPKHSDGEGMAKIPQDIPDEYLSDGEMVDLVVELFEENMGLSVDAAALQYHREEFAKQLEGDEQ